MSAGPWFEALDFNDRHPGECSFGDHSISPGDEIRADGSGGWECRECVERDAALDPDQTWTDDRDDPFGDGFDPFSGDQFMND